MSSENAGFIPQKYAADIEYEYAGMINTLIYLSQEAKEAHLDLVCLHLNIAIAELREEQPPKVKSG